MIRGTRPRRFAVVADTYTDGRAAVLTLPGLTECVVVSLVTPTTHPGAIAGIVFDAVHRLTHAALNPRTEEHLGRLKEPSP